MHLDSDFLMWDSSSMGWQGVAIWFLSGAIQEWIINSEFFSSESVQVRLCVWINSYSAYTVHIHKNLCVCVCVYICVIMYVHE